MPAQPVLISARAYLTQRLNVGVQPLLELYRFGFRGGVGGPVVAYTAVHYGRGVPVADMPRKQLLQEHEPGVFLQAALERFSCT